MELNIIKEKLEHFLKEHDYELYDLKFKKMGDYFLEVIVDRVKPIDMDAIKSISSK